MEEVGSTPDSIAAQIESELVTLFGSASTAKCKNKYRSIYFNLKDEKNAFFREILIGNVRAYDLVRMTPEQMAPSDLAEWRKQEEEKGLEAIKRAELEKLAEAKKQELIGKGVEDAVQVAEESKPRDISDVIVDPEKEKRKKEQKDRSRSHHHDSRHSHSRSKDKYRHSSSSRGGDRDKDRKDTKSRDKDRDRDKHRYSSSDKDKKSDRDKERRHSSSSSRHKSSSSSSSSLKSSDKDKDRKKYDDKDKSRSDRDRSRHSTKSKVRYAI